jgi:hypothetical protein
LGYRKNQARNFYFYQSLTTFNKLEIMSDVGPVDTSVGGQSIPEVVIPQ